tara:strand:- start:653 stop:844 length:192 start_codon:yes stop_codon:yes gene_type:complete
MMMRGQRFGNYAIAKLEAQRVANEMECNVPIYFKDKYYYHWNGDDLIEWVKPEIEDDDDIYSF